MTVVPIDQEWEAGVAMCRDRIIKEIWTFSSLESYLSMVTVTWMPSVLVEGDWQENKVTYSGRRLEKLIYLRGKTVWPNVCYFRFWKIVLAIISFISGGGRKAQFEHRGNRPSLLTTAGKYQDSIFVLSSFIWDPCPLLIGPENHVSSVLLHLPLLRHGEDVLGFSFASSLDGLWTAMYFCPLCCSWPEVVNEPVFWHPTWMLHALASGSPACAKVALSAQLFCSQPNGATLVPGTEALLCRLNRCFTEGREYELLYGRFYHHCF